MKYCVVPLGCQMNKSDAERIAQVLEQQGHTPTENEEEADILGVVACSVRQKSVNRVYGRIQKWMHWKKERDIITFLSGCVLPIDEEKLQKQFDIIFKINDLPKLPEYLEKQTKNKQKPIITKQNINLFDYKTLYKDYNEGFWKIQPKHTSNFHAFVPIQNGCNKYCTYCAVPYTRGREVSRNSDEILTEIQDLVNQGYKSITLLGQNVNSYGKDKSNQELTFTQLLHKIGKLGNNQEKKFWLYYTSPHPSDITIDVLEAMAQYNCIAKQIHLPLQSGDDQVLQKMNRSYTLDHYRNIIHQIHQILPTATIFTDIIVGFTDETKEQFNNTLQALQEFQFNMAYIAQYSPRPGAKSATWDDNVSPEEKKQRYHQLTQALQQITYQQNKNMIQKTYTALVEGPDKKKGHLLARTEGLIPINFPETDTNLIGTFVSLKVHSVTPFAASATRI
ncbi:MAG: tRNA (N6-isopentenyl adenosine(37)-C2)-methylthiotransferase MiaB [Planctomycetes bacterium]|nr:tRNA (N6-isopentenyl adenosine(37)-C2)-methylthiotransferase MiaB [Planctomycetota bacterium]HNZ66528.1 tRNA (N6-isopentenyl adenosine(37)-C2)-methylthiotransferase MiaB [Planctomycetota bacterium]HPY74433.1 tRNA (N6-isopentenyl adenosine(37)-C2)-methylthiotransferase MiaB [Planctomycetota bacterium]HQA99984.1 tRNA (N6-isopentenyl adenosine(37)-C2)-methylthiotransferase MiaB [Planctomycetota bacterium]